MSDEASSPPPPWINDGISQPHRFPAALSPTFFKVDDRSEDDLLRLVEALASKLYFDKTLDITWDALVSDIQARQSRPHLALIKVFVKLFAHAQAHLNTLNQAHLDYYYQQVLGFRPRPAKPDKLVVFPTLAKGVDTHRLPVGTELDAGKDAEGNELVYVTDREIVVSRAQVVRFDSIRIERDDDPSLQIEIDIANLVAPQTLLLHFAVIEGSGAALNEGGLPPDIVWALPDREFSDSAVTDGTRGLLQPGIISFEFTADIRPNKDGLCRLVGTPRSAVRSVGTITAVKAQAVSAVLRLGETVPVHLRERTRTGLPAGLVKDLVQPQSEITAVEQPYTSFGGRAAEEARGLYTRASERLRHRNRAVTPWDYERLVLDGFPEIYKALCVRAVETPAKVTVVVVPGTAHAPWLDSLMPQARPALLQRIEQQLGSLSSPTAQIAVINPFYETLAVSCMVTFKSGKSAGFYLEQLNEDLRRFLTPWAYDASVEIVFGGAIHQSKIQAFIARLDYVDHFNNFTLSQGVPGQDISNQVIEARCTHPWSVLVSASRHDLHLPPPLVRT